MKTNDKVRQEKPKKPEARKVKSSDSGCDCPLPITTNPLAPISPEEDEYNYKRHE